MNNNSCKKFNVAQKDMETSQNALIDVRLQMKRQIERFGAEQAERAAKDTATQTQVNDLFALLNLDI